MLSVELDTMPVEMAHYEIGKELCRKNTDAQGEERQL